MASFSSGLAVGSSITNQFFARQDRQKQQVIANDFAERQLGIQEAVEGRRAEQFDFQNDLESRTSDFSKLQERKGIKPVSKTSVVDMDAFSKDVQANGEVQATFNVLKGAFSGDPYAMLNDAVGQQIGLSMMKWSDKFNQNVDSNTGWTASKIVQVDDGSGEPKFMIGMEDQKGNQSAMTQGRGNDREPVLFSGADLIGFQVDGMRERGLFSDPKTLAQMAEEGLDVEETLRQFGDDTSSKIPTATNLHSATKMVQDVKKVERKSNLTQLNDGTVRPTHKQAVFGSQEDFGNFLSEQATEGEINQNRGEGLTNDDINFALGQRQEQAAFDQANPTPDDIAFRQQENKEAIISDALGAVDSVQNFISDGLDQAGDILGAVKGAFTYTPDEIAANVAEADRIGKVPAAGRRIAREFEPAIELGGKVVDAIGDKFTSVYRDLFGPAEKEGFKEGATDKERSKAEASTSENINNMDNPTRVKVGEKDIKSFTRTVERQERNPDRNYTPTPKQQAVAARMFANGLLGQASYDLYLQTGKFSTADVNAARLENVARTNALKAQTSARKAAKDGKDSEFKAAKEIFDSNLEANATILEQSLNSVPSFRKMKDSHNFDLNKQAKSMLTIAALDPRVQKLLGVKGFENINGKGMAIIADVIASDVLPEFHKGSDNFFSRSIDPSVITSDKIVNAIGKRFKAD